MNPVNATTLYVSACRSVLQCDPEDPQALAEIYKLLPFFRQSLSCLVCGNLLLDPIAPTNSSCQHYVCKSCKGKKMMMKPSCSWCKDYEQFEENKQLCILVDCYRKLCEYIAESPLSQHISSAVEGAPEILALVNEGLSLDSRQGEESLSLSLANQSPTPSTSETLPDEGQSPLNEIKEQDLSPLGVNGLQDCNGLTNVEELTASLPSLETDVPDRGESGDEVVKQESFTNEIPVCEAVAAAGEELCTTTMDICGFGEDIKHDGGTLLLSVEEVLRTLEPDHVPQDECPVVLQSTLEPSGNLNGPFGCSTTSVDSTRQLSSLPHDSQEVLLPQYPTSQKNPQPSGISCSAVTPRVPSSSRKRSRSESDSEKIQPLPISTFIRGPTLGTSAPIPVKCEPKSPAQTIPLMAAVPNGGGLSKVGKTLLVPAKNVKKTLDHHGPKKAYTKSKQGTPKTKDKTKERIMSSTLIPGSPTKVVYKKAQEKKGCKCGRATQNPSVLTCRGQRCPCYSNRKACLDCICRGCQNSYMANGEKKLEAFAVPEKALEQTRLTLGINVTSIAVRNAAGSGAAGMLNVSTAAGSPVASFLATGPHEDKGFDEPLDMRFD
ncbi:E3 ubiquitin-protein ligase MSL2-like [Myxocyprinus asiaticus]|uniref:E3 ubiquitin-protein ligase MSL2-like n=1 Tax=Myxocyprinus asiaticus TaxID=70543 RepID=UPI00222311C0|nr:E3 ubiquitin-protein ligase MSL2-like [Myxocyprinus asiaticus]